MRILVCTPASGGMVTTQWMLSFISTYAEANKLTHSQSLIQHIEAAHRASIDRPITLSDFVNKVNSTPKVDYTAQYDVGLYTMANEALIGRGRNHCAQVVLTQGWDKLFFIDADAGWTWSDFKSVVDSASPIVGGACPLKIYPITLNYQPKKSDLKYHDKNGFKTVENMMAMRDGHGGFPEVAVDFLGTAFLCIDRKVLLKLSETADAYGYPTPGSGQKETHWDFFKCSAIKGQYMSEDWGFCYQAKEHGYEIKLNTDVIITHSGCHTFVAQRPVLNSQATENRKI